MRVLGLDIGAVRVGVALSDAERRIASPLDVLPASALVGDARALLRLLDEYDVDRVVVGVPISLDGSEGPQAAEVRSVGDRLARALPVPLEYWDERLSSAQARRSMREAGVPASRQRGSVDKIAAAIFLQSWLDAQMIDEETV